jgi:hypothetical protein
MIATSSVDSKAQLQRLVTQRMPTAVGVGRAVKGSSSLDVSNLAGQERGNLLSILLSPFATTERLTDSLSSTVVV